MDHAHVLRAPLLIKKTRRSGEQDRGEERFRVVGSAEARTRCGRILAAALLCGRVLGGAAVPVPRLVAVLAVQGDAAVRYALFQDDPWKPLCTQIYGWRSAYQIDRPRRGSGECSGLMNAPSAVQASLVASVQQLTSTAVS